MSFFTRFVFENPWPAVVVCTLGSLLLVLVWNTTRRGIHLVGAGVVLAAGATVFFIERAVVTEAEEVEAAVRGLVDAVVAGDIERTMNYFSNQAPDRFRHFTMGALLTYDVEEDVAVTDVQVEMRPQNSLGLAHFRANGTVTRKGSGIGGRGATRWRLTWRREEREWKVVDAQRLDFFTGEPIDFMAPPAQ